MSLQSHKREKGDTFYIDYSDWRLGAAAQLAESVM